MYYFVSETKLDGEMSKTAWSKARNDVEIICHELEWHEISLGIQLNNRKQANALFKFREHIRVGKVWAKAFSCLKKGDSLLLQIPVINNSFLLGAIMAGLKKNGVRIVLLVHDLEALRMSCDRKISIKTRFRILIEEKSIISLCDKIIVHNEKMMQFMEEYGLNQEQLVNLRIFDYVMQAGLDEDREQFSCSQRDTLIVAGNLHPDKAGYLYTMPESIDVNLYGVHYSINKLRNLHYQGAFRPEDLPYKMAGGFGLVWDGTSTQTCEGVYGAYLRYNNPHKMSLYLAAGFPVIVWEEAALADFVKDNGLGICVKSLNQIPDVLSMVSEQEYIQMKKRVLEIGKKLRNGAFLKMALHDSII